MGLDLRNISLTRLGRFAFKWALLPTYKMPDASQTGYCHLPNVGSTTPGFLSLPHPSAFPEELFGVEEKHGALQMAEKSKNCEVDAF